MKNKQIIAIAAVKANLCTAEEARKILEGEKEEFPLHTLAKWNEIGKFRVKEGEVGIVTKLWRKKEDGFYLVNATLYTREQLQEVR